MQCRNKTRLPMNKTNEVGGGDISAIALASPPDPASWDWKSNLARLSSDLYRVGRFSNPYHDMPCPDDNDDLLAGDYFEVNISDPGKVQPDDFIIVPYLGGSDYSGDSVNVSNYRAFKKRFGDCRGVHEIVGGHGTYGIAVRADCFTPEMSEYLERLAVYPILDENICEEIELEARDEAWDSWLKWDFEKALEEEFGVDLYDLGLDDDDKLYELFHKAFERANAEWIIQTGNSVTVDLDRIISVITADDLAG